MWDTCRMPTKITLFLSNFHISNSQATCKVRLKEHAPCTWTALMSSQRCAQGLWGLQRWKICTTGLRLIYFPLTYLFILLKCLLQPDACSIPRLTGSPGCLRSSNFQQPPTCPTQNWLFFPHRQRISNRKGSCLKNRLMFLAKNKIDLNGCE